MSASYVLNLFSFLTINVGLKSSFVCSISLFPTLECCLDQLSAAIMFDFGDN